MGKTIEYSDLPDKARAIHERYYNRWKENPNECTEAVACAVREALMEVFSLPLVDRLTKTEKTSIGNIYNNSIDNIIELDNNKDASAYDIGLEWGTYLTILSVFGKEISQYGLKCVYPSEDK